MDLVIGASSRIPETIAEIVDFVTGSRFASVAGK
jgi:hypothetical protein